MSILEEKIQALSTSDQKKVEIFVEYLHFKSWHQISDLDQNTLENRLREMKANPESTVESGKLISELKAKYSF